MLRNLLYSIFFHIMFVALLLLSTVNFSANILQPEITPLTINFMNENALSDLKKIKTEKVDERVKDMNIEEKIDLYTKIKNAKNNKIKPKNEKVIFDKSTKLENKKTNVEVSNKDENNEFSYYYTPVYVAEDKVNTEEKRKLIENRLKREELRKTIREKKLVPEVNVQELQQFKKLEDVIKISQKPLVVKKKEDKKDVQIKKEIGAMAVKTTKEVEVTSTVTEESIQKNDNIDELIEQINGDIPTIDTKYEDLSEDKIFSEEDYKRLKEMEEGKEDRKYILSLREKRNIQRQIKGCYKMAILRNKLDSKAIVALTVQVSENGTINMTNIKVNKIVDNFDSESFNIALENAKSALVFCSPLRGLPIAKYRMWRQMTFVFDSNNLE